MISRLPTSVSNALFKLQLPNNTSDLLLFNYSPVKLETVPTHRWEKLVSKETVFFMKLYGGRKLPLKISMNRTTGSFNFFKMADKRSK